MGKHDIQQESCSLCFLLSTAHFGPFASSAFFCQQESLVTNFERRRRFISPFSVGEKNWVRDKHNGQHTMAAPLLVRTCCRDALKKILLCIEKKSHTHTLSKSSYVQAYLNLIVQSRRRQPRHYYLTNEARMSQTIFRLIHKPRTSSK